MQEEDLYRIRVVRQDLEFIQSDWRDSIPEPSLRRSSNVLRTLLVNGELGRAWRSLGLEKQPVVLAPDLDSIIRGIPRELIEFAQAGVANYKQMRVMSLVQGNYPVTPEDFVERSRRGPFAATREFPLTRLLESPCLVFRGSTINRRELIQYIANKLGGTHIDLTRDDTKDLDRRLKEIDELQRGMEVMGLSPCYFELLSLGQALVGAPDIERFLSVASNLEND
jgi:hypothetical protein